MTSPILEVREAQKHFRRRSNVVTAVDRVNLRVLPGRSVGIAGESGSGKSTLMRLLLDLERADGGSVLFEGTSLLELSVDKREQYRAAVQAVFQDPASSLSPRKRVWYAVTEPIAARRRVRKDERMELAGRLLGSVELKPEYLDRYPHQLSGGERQRVAIARALSSAPRVILLDEPVTSLDVSVRGRIINLLRDHGESNRITYVVISHDLAATYHLTSYLCVMYAGKVIEEGPTADVISSPAHPYTRLLVSATDNPLHQQGIDVDTPVPSGACPYLHRCEYAMAKCAVMPQPTDLGGGRIVRCHLTESAQDIPGRTALKERPN